MATHKFDITDLLSSKSFEELTVAERTFAIEELGSEMAYREMFEVVQGTADYEAPKITASKRAKTFAAFDELHAEETTKKRGVIWLRPLVIGLAAASIIGFVWLIGFSELGKNQTLAENKTPIQQEAKDSIIKNESLDKKEELEQGKNEAKSASASAVEDETFDKEEHSAKVAPAVTEEKMLIAEERDIPQTTKAKDEELPESISIAYSEKTASAEIFEEEINISDMATDSDVSFNEAEISQPVLALESTVVSDDRSKRASKSGINMNSNISKQSLFKLKLPLHNHYTSY